MASKASEGETLFAASVPLALSLAFALLVAVDGVGSALGNEPGGCLRK